MQPDQPCTGRKVRHGDFLRRRFHTYIHEHARADQSVERHLINVWTSGRTATRFKVRAADFVWLTKEIRG